MATVVVYSLEAFKSPPVQRYGKSSKKLNRRELSCVPFRLRASPLGFVEGGQFVDRAMEAISQRVAELATPHWPLPPTLVPLTLERIPQGRKTTQTH